MEQISVSNLPSSQRTTVLINGSDERFRQRQADIFSALDNLQGVRSPVVECKESILDDDHSSSGSDDDVGEVRDTSSRSITASSTQCNKNVDQFRKPNLPPIRNKQFNRHMKRDPNKWTHYSLADVDEDAVIVRRLGDDIDNGDSHDSYTKTVRMDSNSVIAHQFISELRERRQSSQSGMEEGRFGNRIKNERILFRSNRCKKRARFCNDSDVGTDYEKHKTRQGHQSDLLQNLHFTNDNDDDDDGQLTTTSTNSNLQSTIQFTKRRQHRSGLRCNHELNSIDGDASDVCGVKSTASDVDEDEEMKDHPDVDDEFTDTGEENPEEEDDSNNYLA